MKVQIDENEIKEAVICYLDKQGVNVNSYDLSFIMVSGRADTGPRIEISLDKKKDEVENEFVAQVKAPFDTNE